MAGGRFNETFAPRLGWELLMLVPMVAMTASFVASVILFFGFSVAYGFGEGLFFSAIVGAVALFVLLGGLTLLAVPLTFLARRLGVSWGTASGVAAITSIVASGLFGLVRKSPDFWALSTSYAIITAVVWLFALHHFAGPIQPADIDDPVGNAA